MEKEPKERISVSNLDEIIRKVKEKKSDVQVKKDHNSIIIQKGSKKFVVNEDGIVKGSMPLHSFHTSNADSLEIRDDGIEVHYENGNYVFKI